MTQTPPLGVGDRPADPDTTSLARIPGLAIDPPPIDVRATQAMLDDRHVAAGLAFRTVNRFLHARAPLLAAGTTYYLFLSVISVVAFAYGAVALIGAERLAIWLTEALNNAFPGLIGEDGISPEEIRGYGTTASIVGLVVLAFAGTGAIHAVGQSLHLIYGAPKDPRNFILARVRMLGQLLILGPLMLLSFVPALLVTTVAEPIRAWLSVETSFSRWLLLVATTLISLGLNYLVISLMLGRLGGIRPPNGPLRIGAGLGALATEALKFTTATIISYSLGRPRYGAFAVPITMMLVLYLMSSVLYASACLTAAIAIGRTSEASPEPGQQNPA